METANQLAAELNSASRSASKPTVSAQRKETYKATAKRPQQPFSPFGTSEWAETMKTSMATCSKTRDLHNTRAEVVWTPGLQYDKKDCENWPYAGTQADPKDKARPPAYTKLSDYWVAKLVANDPRTTYSERGTLWRWDFTVNGEPKRTRHPRGDPVIVKKGDALYIPVVRHYYLLCGEQLAARFPWLINICPSSGAKLWAGLFALPSSSSRDLDFVALKITPNFPAKLTYAYEGKARIEFGPNNDIVCVQSDLPPIQPRERTGSSESVIETSIKKDTSGESGSPRAEIPAQSVSNHAQSTVPDRHPVSPLFGQSERAASSLPIAYKKASPSRHSAITTPVPTRVHPSTSFGQVQSLYYSQPADVTMNAGMGNNAPNPQNSIFRSDDPSQEFIDARTSMNDALAKLDTIQNKLNIYKFRLHVMERNYAKEQKNNAELRAQLATAMNTIDHLMGSHRDNTAVRPALGYQSYRPDPRPCENQLRRRRGAASSPPRGPRDEPRGPRSQRSPSPRRTGSPFDDRRNRRDSRERDWFTFVNNRWD
ncbi:hypothetical protein N8T08_000304 [Aspergillus melleus]|uniref:Uncharacterized protein n=1 Tax=Aspergillus melleus TaxID=138277 RepID=A0ACC3BB55_9EURO|nr:hypothetical protein N8T08_000304 [Aspergillus melleus]